MYYRRFSIIVFVATMLSLSLLIPGSGWDAIRPIRASTIVVTTTADSGAGSLRAAIASAAAGDTITFSAGGTGVITLTSGVLSINKSLTITGPSQNTLIIDGNSTFQVFNISAGTVHLSGMTVRFGNASFGGGIFNGGTLTLSNSAIDFNTATTLSGGGGISNGGTLTINNSLLAGNTVSGNGGSGGGIQNTGSLTINNTVILGNTTPSTGNGGGGISSSGTLTINNSTIAGNSGSVGGGINNHHTLTISNSTIYNNTASSADLGGGGIFSNGVSGDSFTISNSTISGNSASANSGGGVYVADVLTLRNSTISGNSVSGGSGGGIFVNPLHSMTMSSTIVADNTGTKPDLSGVVTSQGNNLIGNTTGASGFVGSDQQNVNPLLNVLAFNAPGTTETMSLQVGSPAIIHGNCSLSPAVTTDQRGIHRKNLCDVGAYETPGTPTETVGLFDPATAQFYLKNTNAAGTQDFLFGFGSSPSSFVPLVGDWTGQGIKTPGLYDPATSTFFLRNSNTSGSADITIQFGTGGQGFIPIVGDWQGQGHDGIGIYSPSSAFFYLKNSLVAGPADLVFAYGPANAGLTPLAGDWTGRGFATVGLFSQANAFFYLHDCNTTSCSNSDIIFQYGPATSNGGAPATPLTDRWIGQRNTTIGVYVPANAFFYLKNTNAAGNADIQFQFGPGPNAGWKPIMGHWATPGPHTSGVPQSVQINGALGFVSNRDGKWGIYQLNGDEQHLQQLIVIGKNPLASRPAWSSDGKQVALVSDREGSPALYVMNTDGSNLKRLTWNSGLNYQPSWSPDGKQIVFASNLGNSTNLYVIEVNSGAIRQLTHSINDLNEQPSWSPDGSQIAFATGKGTLDIALISVDGKTSKVLTRNGRQPSWSPDGKQIVFASTRDGNSQLYVMNADGSNVRRLTNSSAQDEVPGWSPDGKQIVFASTRDGNSQLYVMNADGSNIRRLTNSSAQDQFPVWLPR